MYHALFPYTKFNAISSAALPSNNRQFAGHAGKIPRARDQQQGCSVPKTFPQRIPEEYLPMVRLFILLRLFVELTASMFRERARKLESLLPSNGC